MKFLVHAAKREASPRITARGQCCVCAWHLWSENPCPNGNPTSSGVPHRGKTVFKSALRITNPRPYLSNGNSTPVGAWLLGPGNWESDMSLLRVTVLLGLSGSSRVPAFVLTDKTRVTHLLLLRSYRKCFKGEARSSAIFLDWSWMVQSWTGWKTSASIMKLDLGLPLVS